MKMSVVDFMNRELNEEEKFFYDFMHNCDSWANESDEVLMRLANVVRIESYMLAVVDDTTAFLYYIYAMLDADSASGYSYNYDMRRIDKYGSIYDDGACFWGYMSALDLLNKEELSRVPSTYRFYDVSGVYSNIYDMDDKQTYAEFMESIKDVPELEVEYGIHE